MSRRRKPIAPRKASRAPKAADGPGAQAPKVLLPEQRAPSSDMQRAMPYPVASEETGLHGGADEPGVPGFLEPRTPETGAR